MHNAYADGFKDGEGSKETWICYDGRSPTSEYRFSTTSRTSAAVKALKAMVKAHNANPHSYGYKKRVALAGRGPRGAFVNGKFYSNFYSSWLPEKSGNITHYDVYVYDVSPLSLDTKLEESRGVTMTIVRSIPALFQDKLDRQKELKAELLQLDEELCIIDDIEDNLDEQVENIMLDVNKQIENIKFNAIEEVRDHINNLFEVMKVDNSNLNSLYVAVDYVESYIEWEEK